MSNNREGAPAAPVTKLCAVEFFGPKHRVCVLPAGHDGDHRIEDAAPVTPAEQRSTDGAPTSVASTAATEPGGTDAAESRPLTVPGPSTHPGQQALTDLLPCPFCGSTPILHDPLDTGHQPVECPNETCCMSRAWPDITQWQTQFRVGAAARAEPVAPAGETLGEPFATVLADNLSALTKRDPEGQQALTDAECHAIADRLVADGTYSELALIRAGCQHGKAYYAGCSECGRGRGDVARRAGAAARAEPVAILQRVAYGATGNTIKESDPERLADKIVADVCNTMQEYEREIDALRAAPPADDARCPAFQIAPGIVMSGWDMTEEIAEKYRAAIAGKDTANGRETVCPAYARGNGDWCMNCGKPLIAHRVSGQGSPANGRET